LEWVGIWEKKNELTGICIYLVNIRCTLSTESTLPTSNDVVLALIRFFLEILATSIAIHRTAGPRVLFVFFVGGGKITPCTDTRFGGANPINASNVALPPRSNDNFD
jgi:hypothetical protein